MFFLSSCRRSPPVAVSLHNLNFSGNTFSGLIHPQIYLLSLSHEVPLSFPFLIACSLISYDYDLKKLKRFSVANNDIPKLVPSDLENFGLSNFDVNNDLYWKPLGSKFHWGYGVVEQLLLESEENVVGYSLKNPKVVVGLGW